MAFKSFSLENIIRKIIHDPWQGISNWITGNCSNMWIRFNSLFFLRKKEKEEPFNSLIQSKLFVPLFYGTNG